MPAKFKIYDDKTLISLAKSIKEKHDLISREMDELETIKASLSKSARCNFFKDLTWECDSDGNPVLSLEGTPELFGNHEIPIDNNDKVTVNFKFGAKTFGKVDGVPADTQLKAIFGEEAYKKLFKEQVNHEVTSNQAEQDEHAQSNPEFFGISLRQDAPKDELMKLADKYPTLLNKCVINVKGYAKTFPNAVENTTLITTGAGFIEKAGKLDVTLLKNAKNFLAGLFKASLSISIICGNTNKK